METSRYFETEIIQLRDFMYFNKAEFLYEIATFFNLLKYNIQTFA